VWFSSTQFSSVVSEKWAICSKSQRRNTTLLFTMDNKNSSIFEVRGFRYGFHEQIIWEHLQYLKCRLLLHCFFRYQFAHCICYVATIFPWFDISTVELLLWDTSLQETPPFRGHKIWSRKNVDIIFVSVTSIEGIPLLRGKGHFLWVPKPRLNLHLGDTPAPKKWLTTKA